MSKSASISHPSDKRDILPLLFMRLLFGTAAISLIMVFAHVWVSPQTQPGISAPVAQEVPIRLTRDETGIVLSRIDQSPLLLSRKEARFANRLLRVVQRQRSKSGTDLTAPLHLIVTATGRMSLEDPFTNWRAEISSFGTEKTAAFATLLQPPARAVFAQSGDN